jgi:hypothetical protein
VGGFVNDAYFMAEAKEFEVEAQHLRDQGAQPMPTATKGSAAPFVPEDRTLAVLREAVQHCHGCDLYRNATQAVFGELETGAKATKLKVAVMMIGEQPGDQEDKQGPLRSFALELRKAGTAT